jgi:hypothetical protein
MVSRILNLNEKCGGFEQQLCEYFLGARQVPAPKPVVTIRSTNSNSLEGGIFAGTYRR